MYICAGQDALPYAHEHTRTGLNETPIETSSPYLMARGATSCPLLVCPVLRSSLALTASAARVQRGASRDRRIVAILAGAGRLAQPPTRWRRGRAGTRLRSSTVSEGRRSDDTGVRVIHLVEAVAILDGPGGLAQRPPEPGSSPTSRMLRSSLATKGWHSLGVPSSVPSVFDVAILAGLGRPAHPWTGPSCAQPTKSLL